MANSGYGRLPASMGAIALGADVGQAFAQYNSMQDDEEAIDRQAKVTQLQYLQKSIANYDSLDKLIASQKAMASVRGYTTDSASFNAIQRETFNAGGRMQQNLNTEKAIADLNAETERQKVRDKFQGEIFGDIAGAASSAFKIFS